MRALFALVFVLVLVPPAAAQECVPSTSSSSGDMTVVELPTCDSTACYVVVDHSSSGCMGAVWVYPEANGIAGLQRGDECHDDTCGGQIDSDTFLV